MSEIERLMMRNLELLAEIDRLKQRHQSPGLTQPDFRRKMRDRVAIALLSAWESIPDDSEDVFNRREITTSLAMDYAEIFINESERRYEHDRARAAAAPGRGRAGNDVELPPHDSADPARGPGKSDPLARSASRARISDKAGKRPPRVV